jgi:hypothetical protein
LGSFRSGSNCGCRSPLTGTSPKGSGLVRAVPCHRTSGLQFRGRWNVVHHVVANFSHLAACPPRPVWMGCSCRPELPLDGLVLAYHGHEVGRDPARTKNKDDDPIHDEGIPETLGVIRLSRIFARSPARPGYPAERRPLQRLSVPEGAQSCRSATVNNRRRAGVWGQVLLGLMAMPPV